uniref:Dynamin-type G domain-containing protein n=1 Tax=Salmo trutta TaxID=8032 RepID=A0A673X9U1_SALTR
TSSISNFFRHRNNRVRPYIDLIDYLRSIGIDQDLPLPAIAVVRDQSSGKSSVLEALSGVALPRGNGIVTRCPLELRLCYVSGVAWKAVISYRDKLIIIGDPSEVAGHNELAGEGVGICDELISLKIMSSSVCDLALTDLPGITRVPVQGQPEDIGAQIKCLILKILSKQKTINLVVVPCNVDIATTEALKMAKEVDPEGTRTLAILMKPDLIDRGTEKDVLDIVRNKIIPLNMGYVIVKCRGQKQMNDGVTINDAIEEERDFFENHDEFSAARLTQTLVNHIQVRPTSNHLSLMHSSLEWR